MIEKQGNQRIIVCDSCEDDFEPYDKDEFFTMIAAARAVGWQISPGGEGHFLHKCADCAGSNMSRLEQARRLLG